MSDTQPNEEDRSTERSLAGETGSVSASAVREMLADPVKLRANILRHGPAGYDLFDATLMADAEVVGYDGTERTVTLRFALMPCVAIGEIWKTLPNT